MLLGLGPALGPLLGALEGDGGPLRADSAGQAVLGLVEVAGEPAHRGLAPGAGDHTRVLPAGAGRLHPEQDVLEAVVAVLLELQPPRGLLLGRVVAHRDGALVREVEHLGVGAEEAARHREVAVGLARDLERELGRARPGLHRGGSLRARVRRLAVHCQSSCAGRRRLGSAPAREPRPAPPSVRRLRSVRRAAPGREEFPRAGSRVRAPRARRASARPLHVSALCPHRIGGLWEGKNWGWGDPPVNLVSPERNISYARARLTSDLIFHLLKFILYQFPVGYLISFGELKFYVVWKKSVLNKYTL